MVIIVKNAFNTFGSKTWSKVYIHKTFKIYSYKTGWGSKGDQSFIMYEMDRGQGYVVEWYDCFEDIKKLKNYHKAVLKLIKKKWWVKDAYTFFYTKHSHGGGHRFTLANIERANKYVNSCITPDGLILMTNYDDNGVTLYNPLNNKIYLKTRGGIYAKDLIRIIKNFQILNSNGFS